MCLFFSWLAPWDCSQLLEGTHIPASEGMGQRAKVMLMANFWGQVLGFVC